MDAAQLLEEYRLAQEEHARALAEVEAVRKRVETARAEADAAQATERKYERDVEIAAAKVVDGLSLLQVTDAPATLPPVENYLVEYHANIGCYHCYLVVGGDATPSDVGTSVLSVSVDGTKVVLSSVVGEWWTVELERRVDPENCSTTVKDDHIYVRLPVGDSDKETVDGFSSFSQTSQEELRVDSYHTLSCRSCETVLMENTHIEKVLPLPSENWMEMFDFWGAGIGSFEHLPRDGIFAHEHRVFVGESTIILHENDLSENAVVTDTENHINHRKLGAEDDDEEEKVDWVKVSCSKCSVIFGERRIENPATLRLHKHLLVASSRATDHAINVFHQYTIDSTISAQMLHVAESDGIFRFLLKPPADGDADAKFTGLQLQLMSWDAKIRASSSPASASGFRRVLKVVYRTGLGTTSITNSPAPTAEAELPPLLRIHELMVTSAVGCEILQRLEESTLLLPPSQRHFNKMTVGYLHA